MSTPQRNQVDATDRRVRELVDAVEEGGLTRREAIKRAVALGVSLSAVGALFPGRASATRGATKIVRLADVGRGAADTLDPHKQTGGMDGMRITSLHDKLVINDSNYNPHPWLAQEITPNKTATQWTVVLHDAEFHDGRSVTADDVKFTVEQILDPSVGSKAISNFGFMTGGTMKVLDRKTIQFNLANPYPDFLGVFGDAGVNILPRATFKASTANTNPIGCGPFKFASFQPGQQSIFVKNHSYWNEKFPLADELHIIDIPDSSARTNALLGGQVDVITNVGYTQIPSFGKKMKIWDIPGNILAPLVMPPDLNPHSFRDKRVREALALCLDREQIVKVAYLGYARVGDDQPISSSYGALAPTGIPVRPLDPERAKHLMKAAGHGNGLTQTLIVSELGPAQLSVGTLVQEQAKAAGFNIKLLKWPSDSFDDQVWLKKPFYISNWTQRATPELFLATTSYTNSIWNESHFYSKAVDRLLGAARVEVDTRKRQKLYTQAMTIVSNSATWLFPAYGNLLHVSQPNFSWLTRPPASAGPYLHNATVG
jgi:peptide/nickel transport system substrate-binding protein